MSNEYKDWIQDRFSDVLLENEAIDKVVHTEVKDWVNWRAIVDGIKDNIPLKYEVWFNDKDEDDGWNYKLIL